MRKLLALILAVSPLFLGSTAYAGPLTSKSVTVGSSVPSANTTHQFKFTVVSVSNVGSIELEYCSNTPLVGTSCSVPAGLSVSSAILQSQTGETGFSIDASTTANRLVLSRPSVPTSAIPVTYNFSNITNHSPPNSTVYVRIATFASSDGTGARTDEGGVAFATASNIAVAGYVPPYLIFCVGVTVSPNCTSFSGTLLDFGEFSTAQPRFLTSQFAVATNDPTGYSTTVSGTTMTSGNNVIQALNPPSFSQPGVSQFGMNLRANTNPAVGADPSGVGTGTIAAGFNTPNQFYFNNQVVVSSSIPSDFNAFTASYLANISNAQRPGIYATTLTYIASAAF